jgi:hypothetical protein
MVSVQRDAQIIAEMIQKRKSQLDFGPAGFSCAL